MFKQTNGSDQIIVHSLSANTDTISTCVSTMLSMCDCEIHNIDFFLPSQF